MYLLSKTSVGWADRGWNPGSGCNNKLECYDYCFLRDLEHRKFISMVPTFHPDRLQRPLKKRVPSCRVFVCIAGDIFCPGMRNEWIQQILEVVWQCYYIGKGHKFLFLSKRPEGYKYWDFPSNAWCGTTISDCRSQQQSNRLFNFLSSTQPGRRIISVEPYSNGFLSDMVLHANWIILGGHSKKKVPINESRIDELIDKCKIFDIPTFY